MPLIYQGSLNKKTTAKASTALRFGTQRMGALQHSRVDMRISWPGPEVFGAVDELLSAGQAPIFGSMWQPMRTRTCFSKSHNGLVNSVADTSVSCA